MMRENFKESNYVFLCIYMTRKAVLSLKFSFPREAAAAQHLTQIWQKKKKMECNHEFKKPQTYTLYNNLPDLILAP